MMAVAAEFSDRNFRFDGIVPGSIDTPMLRILPTETLGNFAQTLPMKRRGREVQDGPIGTDHRSRTEQNTAIASYVRWHNAPAETKADSATVSPIRIWTDCPAEAACQTKS